MSNNTEHFDIDLVRQLRELGATDITLPSGLRAVFPATVVKTVAVSEKVAKVREKIDPDADRKKFYAQVLGADQHE